MWNKFHSYCKCTNHCQNERKYYWGLEPRQLFQITYVNWQKSLKGERLLNFLSIWLKKYTNCMEAWFCAIVHRRHTIYGYAIISNTTKIDLFSTYGLGAKKLMNIFWTNDIFQNIQKKKTLIILFLTRNKRNSKIFNVGQIYACCK